MNDIGSILQRYNIPIQRSPHKNVRKGWIGIDCPKCSPHSHKFRMGLQIGTLRAHCWMCGSFFLPDVLSLILRKPKGEIYDIIGTLPKSGGHRRDAEIPLGIYKPPPNVADFAPSHERYLKNRGFDPGKLAQEWGLRGIGISGRLSWRIFIPIFDRFGRAVSWTTRSIATDPNVVRYWSATPDEEAHPHKSLLYGAHKARHTIIVVEGPVDVWSIGPGAVGTLGVGFSTVQKSLIGEYPRRVICFDAEPLAQRRAEQLCEDLCLLPGLTENVMLETGKDANSCDPAEIAELREKYLPEYVLG